MSNFSVLELPPFLNFLFPPPQRHRSFIDFLFPSFTFFFFFFFFFFLLFPLFGFLCHLYVSTTGFVPFNYSPYPPYPDSDFFFFISAPFPFSLLKKNNFFLPSSAPPPLFSLSLCCSFSNLLFFSFLSPTATLCSFFYLPASHDFLPFPFVFFVPFSLSLSLSLTNFFSTS